jgi:hypothetical protein
LLWLFSSLNVLFQNNTLSMNTCQYKPYLHPEFITPLVIGPTIPSETREFAN